MNDRVAIDLDNEGVADVRQAGNRPSSRSGYKSAYSRGSCEQDVLPLGSFAVIERRGA